MPKVISAVTARSKLDQILRRAVKEHARFLIEKEGKPQVVILGIREYIKIEKGIYKFDSANGL
jgi:prevent-host-death family protein